MPNKLRVKIKPFALMDLLSFKNLVPDRKKRFRNASPAHPAEAPPMNVLAKWLHPARQYLAVQDIIEEAPGVKSFILAPDRDKGTAEVAFFRAGQYLSLKLDIDGVGVTRPYSISSSPAEALSGFYKITVKKQEKGFVTDFIFDHWQRGQKVESSGPEGQFYYERLRDLKTLVGLAGGSGITPFMSMAKQFKAENFPVNFTLFYGCNDQSEIIFHDELSALAKESGGRFTVVFVVCGENRSENMEKGLITAELIKKYVDPAQSSFFICGPQGMYEFVKKELGAFQIPVKQIRREMYGEIKTIREQINYPEETRDSYAITVIMGGSSTKIPALSGESLLVAMERAGLKPPSKCRSGDCSFCRCELLKGDLWIPEDTDGRRQADKKFSFIHACASYPLSDVEIIVPHDEL